MLTALAGALALPAVGWAQSDRGNQAFVQQQRQVRDRIWDQIDAEQSPTDKVDFDYGGAYSFNLFLFDDGIESSRTLRRSDLRVWTRLSLDEGAHEFYARGLVSYLDFNSGDSFDRNDNDWEGLNLERGYYQFDLRRALQAYRDQYVDYNVRLKVGRDLVQMGTGLALWDTLDHVWLEAQYADFEVAGLAGRSVGSNFDPDILRPIDRSRRAFFGAQFRYLGFERNRPFAYLLWQRDHNRETWPTPLQEYDYDSFYFGLGSVGELIPNLRYSTEWVYESGRSYGDRRFLRQNVVRAWAFDLELEYLFDCRTSPRASIEYLFGSGDPDRLESPTSSIGGNRGDYQDRSFVGFGYRDTGLSFAPALSNIHIWRAGASFFPFEGEPVVDRLELGTNWFLYWKNRRSGAVSDPTADEQSGYLGWEMDYFANWALTNDLNWTVRYGVFFPGKSFSDETTRTFLLTGVTWSF